MLKHIIGLLKPDKGDVFVDGVHIASAKPKQLEEIRANIGYLFQSAALFDSMNVDNKRLNEAG